LVFALEISICIFIAFADNLLNISRSLLKSIDSFGAEGSASLNDWVWVRIKKGSSASKKDTIIGCIRNIIVHLNNSLVVGINDIWINLFNVYRLLFNRIVQEWLNEVSPLETLLHVDPIFKIGVLSGSFSQNRQDKLPI